VKGRIEGSLDSTAAGCLGLVYVPLLLSFVTAARVEWGVAGVITVIAVCKSASAGAYFVGKAVGRRKLAPLVSPRKTVEGAIGGLAGASAISYALSVSPWGLTGGRWLLYGIAVGLAGTVGDLAASLLKREAGVKDSGALLPGFGGMLDMLDDVLFAAPVSFLLLHSFGIAGG
jgi:phosphatidate cytidylyltransferase